MGAELPHNHFVLRRELRGARKCLGWWSGGFRHSLFLPQLSPTDDPESVYIYDLMATVVHILDSRTGGSLVGHIKVGETYHQRKEVRSCRNPPLYSPRNSWLSKPSVECLVERAKSCWGPSRGGKG